ncbi:CAP domain-containing protein [Paenibacillus hunanensis]|uniref:CAP domain-containing protein n=1 Tax=Paenibacillus hunanensis TaxID=539262 RepID=UPI002A6B1F85|nr:CAP domain-containing protein [Paenibacillus hunanensis]WPP43187.1 CAP domain-containing protein [Paenibacillus hunanensis]
MTQLCIQIEQQGSVIDMIWKTTIKRIAIATTAAALVAGTFTWRPLAQVANAASTTKTMATSSHSSSNTYTTTRLGTSAATSAAAAAKVAKLVNEQRAKAGLKPLTVDTKLQKMAQTKANDMASKGYFSHTSPTYGTPFKMMDTFGITYTYAGENIAKGQSSAAQVMKDWMNSPGHKANILKKQYTHIGVGFKNGVWVQEFIRK